MKTEFKIRENGFNEIKRAMIIRTIPIMILAGGTGLLISHFNSNVQTSEINVLPIVIPIIIGAMGFGMFIGIKRQKELFESYKLSIAENEIIREQKNTQLIKIPIDEITSIVKNSKGALIIIGNSSTNVIGIPSQINEPEKIEQLLNNIFPIKLSDNKPVMEKYKWVLTISMLGLMASVYLSTNKMVVGITGVILIAYLGYSFYEIRRNKNIDEKTKKGMWSLILVLFSIIGTMYFKLIGKI